MILENIQEAVRNRPRYIRAGQQAFNALYCWKPDLADSIRGTDLDPFYNDARLPAFYRHVQEQLGKQEDQSS